MHDRCIKACDWYFDTSGPISRHLDSAKLLLETRAILQYSDRCGDTTLRFACLVRLLLHAGGRWIIRNKYGYSALEIVCQRGHIGIVHELLHGGLAASLCDAIYAGVVQIEMLRLLLEVAVGCQDGDILKFSDI